MAAIPLQAKRRELIAAYGKARRQHATRADVARRLVDLTCRLLRAEIRAARHVAREPSPQADLFSTSAGAAP